MEIQSDLYFWTYTNQPKSPSIQFSSIRIRLKTDLNPVSCGFALSPMQAMHTVMRHVKSYKRTPFSCRIALHALASSSGAAAPYIPSYYHGGNVSVISWPHGQS